MAPQPCLRRPGSAGPEPADEALDGLDRHPGRPADVDDFEVPVADQLIDRRSCDAEGLPGVLDGEQEDELAGVARGRLTGHSGRCRYLFLRTGLPATVASARSQAGVVLAPEPE